MPIVSHRVLSIQSHVVSGYVGNKAAVFPLQLLGFEVDIVNSCMLSNHTGYSAGAPGPKATAGDLEAVFVGLTANNLLPQISHLLTGYAGNADFLAAFVRAVSILRKSRPVDAPPLVYVCDPVLGDDGRLYVSESLIPIYRTKILPLATVLTPNFFELSLLAEVSIETETDAFRACDKLHKSCGIPTIVCTGISSAERPGIISMLVSDADGTERFALDADRLECRFTGSGDLCAALILAWSARGLAPRDAFKSCMASVSAVLSRTLALSGGEQPHSVEENDGGRRCPFPELKVIQSAADILKPPTELVRVREVKDL
jgi:pyridoxine kinase